MELIPQVGTSGIFKFKTPVSLDDSKLYAVASVQPISTLLRRALDAKAIVYDTWGIPESDKVYAEAVAVDRIVIGLCHNHGAIVYVPADYIEKFPDVATVEYKYHAVSIALDYLPAGTDLSDIKEKLEIIALDSLGVKGTARSSVIGQPIRVSAQEHEILKVQRAAKKKVITTVVGKNLRLEDKCILLESRVAELEAIILAGQPAGDATA